MDSRDKLKARYGYSGRQIISTFGLISPGKGLEYGIEAIAKVVDKHPDVLYLILGQTHPCVKKEMGESYRDKLVKLVDQLGVGDHVEYAKLFIDVIENCQALDAKAV